MTEQIITSDAQPETGKFIGFHVGEDVYGEPESVPVATASTREECMAKLTRRILANLVLTGGVAVQRREDVSDEDFKTLSEILDGMFEENGKRRIVS